ncbi:MAG: V4R domain-containing protein [Thermoplasmata archaeon]
MSPPQTGTISKRYAPYVSRAGRHLFSIGIETEDRQGLLAEISAALAGASLNVIAFTGAASGVKGDHATLSFIGETESDAVDPSALQRSLAAIPSVLHVEVEPGRDGVIIESLYPLYSGTGRRAILVSLEPLRDMLARVQETLGSGGSVLLYTEGKAFGDSAWSRVIQHVDGDWAPRHLDYLAGMLTALGWGRTGVTKMEAEQSTATVRLEGCMECFERRSPVIACQFVRGVVESLFTAVWKRPVTSAEVRCSGRGDDVCEFRISPGEPSTDR